MQPKQITIIKHESSYKLEENIKVILNPRSILIFGSIFLLRPNKIHIP
jgi:hypothetical protein